MNYSCYAFIVDRIKLAFQFLLTRDKDGTSAVDLRVFEFIQDTVQDLIEEFEIDNPMYGTLTRTLIEDQIPADDGSGLYPVEASRRIIHVLSAVMDMQFAVNSILRDMRFKVPVDLDKKYPVSYTHLKRRGMAPHPHARAEFDIFFHVFLQS